MHKGNTSNPPAFLRSNTTALDIARVLPQAVAQQVGRWSAKYEYKAVTTFHIADGQLFNPSIKIESCRGYHDLDLIYREIEATATGPDGSNIAECTFYTCRRPRTKPAMDPDSIALEMDNISSAVSRMAGTLLEVDEFSLEYLVNKSSLVIADRVQVQPAFRGTSFWKELFALCLRHALEARVPTPVVGYLHAFPLEFEGKGAGNTEAFRLATYRLQNLYEKAIGAQVLTPADSTGCYMTFPIHATG